MPPPVVGVAERGEYSVSLVYQREDFGVSPQTLKKRAAQRRYVVLRLLFHTSIGPE